MYSLLDVPSGADDESPLGADAGTDEPTPRWVKVFAGIALVLLVLLAVVILTGRGGGHGPGRHIPSSESRGHAAPTDGPPLP